MFDFFKKKEPILNSPVIGKCIPLEKVPDQVFADKMMGEGVAFEPTSNQIFAPCDAKISMIASTKHAIGLVNADGVEILIHIGLDTVNYGGKGFKLHVKKSQKIKRGDVLITFDKDFFESEHVSLVTPMIVTNHSLFDLEYLLVNEEVKTNDVVIRYKKTS